MSRFTFVSAVHIFLIQNDKILLQRRNNTGYMDGYYSVPAGHLEGNEDIFQAMQREAKEEIGLDLTIEQLTCVGLMQRKTTADERFDFFFICTTWMNEPVINEPSKADKLIWSKINELPTNIVPYVRFAIANYLKNQFLSTFGYVRM